MPSSPRRKRIRVKSPAERLVEGPAAGGPAARVPFAVSLPRPVNQLSEWIAALEPVAQPAAVGAVAPPFEEAPAGDADLVPHDFAVEAASEPGGNPPAMADAAPGFLLSAEAFRLEYKRVWQALSRRLRDLRRKARASRTPQDMAMLRSEEGLCTPGVGVCRVAGARRGSMDPLPCRRSRVTLCCWTCPAGFREHR
jgi:hypothetical protein